MTDPITDEALAVVRADLAATEMHPYEWPAIAAALIARLDAAEARAVPDGKKLELVNCRAVTHPEDFAHYRLVLDQENAE
jgi:hypothetical protein